VVWGKTGLEKERLQKRCIASHAVVQLSQELLASDPVNPVIYLPEGSEWKHIYSYFCWHFFAVATCYVFVICHSFWSFGLSFFCDLCCRLLLFGLWFLCHFSFLRGQHPNMSNIISKFDRLL
jgi:hypothetical protein